MPEVFISYSRKDAEFALKLTADLERRGIQVWIDQGDIVAGDAWRKQIVEGIQNCRVFLVVLSPHSATSENVVKELSIAESGHKKIVPIVYQPVEIPKEMEYQLAGLQYQAFDRGNYDENVTRLAQVISSQPAEKTAQRVPVSSAAPGKGANLGKIAFGVGCVLAVLLVACLGSVLLSGPISVFFNVPPKTAMVAPTMPIAAAFAPTTVAPTTLPPTTVAPISPIIMCTPPLCKSDEAYYCPGGNCPGGCGTQCATQTPRTGIPTTAAPLRMIPSVRPGEGLFLVPTLAAPGGLVSYYPFAGNAADYMKRHDAVVYGPVLTTGQDGKTANAYEFDGVNDYMEIPNSTDINFGTNDFSITMWLKYGPQQPVGYNYSTVIIKAENPNSPWTGITLFVDYPASGAVHFRVDAANGVYTTNTKYNDGVFRHFALVRNNNNLRILVNGTLAAEKRVAAISVSNGAPFVIGANHFDRKTQNYKGTIDSLRIYNRALTLDEVQQIYQSGQ